ncbi:MAG: hypothetical protein LBS27_07480 [Bifidobacteriaceae bacterium]|jgi:hypothetical protein|nr:hypothetical protein [Bifidobacteriaceae bacterium]
MPYTPPYNNRETFEYVLSMPIRLKERQQPKYRMVYATNHAAGCILMADNMMKRPDNLAIHIEAFSQGTLFDDDVEGEITDPPRNSAGSPSRCGIQHNHRPLAYGRRREGVIGTRL